MTSKQIRKFRHQHEPNASRCCCSFAGVVFVVTSRNYGLDSVFFVRVEIAELRNFYLKSSDSASEPVQWIFDRNSGNSKKFRLRFLNGILVRVRRMGRKFGGAVGGRLPCVTRHMSTDENVLSPFLTWKRWNVSVEGLHENQCWGNQPNCLQIATMIKVRTNEVLEWQSIQVGATHFPLCSVSWWSSPLGSNICESLVASIDSPALPEDADSVPDDDGNPSRTGWQKKLLKSNESSERDRSSQPHHSSLNAPISHVIKCQINVSSLRLPPTTVFIRQCVVYHKNVSPSNRKNHMRSKKPSLVSIQTTATGWLCWRVKSVVAEKPEQVLFIAKIPRISMNNHRHNIKWSRMSIRLAFQCGSNSRQI